MSAHLQYLRYILRHKWFVFVAGWKVGAPLWRLVIHDWSKFTPAEWTPYVRKFYGSADSEITCCQCRKPLREAKIDNFLQCVNEGCSWYRSVQVRNPRPRVQETFDRAWLHHIHASDHHWQHWILRQDDGTIKLLPMPDAALREMVADWMGAGRAINGTWEVAKWYEQFKDRIELETQTRYTVERLLGRYAGLTCVWDCRDGWSPSYCRSLGGCECHSSRFVEGASPK